MRERLEHLYSNAVQLYLQERQHLFERVNVSLVFSSLLFTAFIVLQTQLVSDVPLRSILSGGIVAVGLAATFLHAATVHRAVAQMRLWHGYLSRIEADPEFWSPVGPRPELHLFSSDTAPRPWWRIRVTTIGIYGYLLPSVLGVLWLLALAVLLLEP